MLLIAIIACEIAFWVLIVAGLVARYPLGRPRLGGVLLALVPLVDLILLALVTIDLLGGATGSWHHGLAAIYIGFSVVYGSRMIRWADERFQHRFADGPPPKRITGRAYALLCWGDVLRTLLAVGIAAGLLAAMAWIVGDPERTAGLTGYYGILFIVLGVDVITAISYTLWPRRPKSDSTAPATS